MVDKAEFNEFMTRKLAEQQERLSKREHVAARQAKVHADLLTGDPRWDKFLSQVQPLLDDSQKELDGLSAAVFNPKLSAEGVTAVRISFAFHQGRVAAFKEAMDLPKVLAQEWNEIKAGDNGNKPAGLILA